MAEGVLLMSEQDAIGPVWFARLSKGVWVNERRPNVLGSAIASSKVDLSLAAGGRRRWRY
jgi:hypothetical protein